MKSEFKAKPKHCGKFKMLESTLDIEEIKELGYTKQIKNENNKYRGYTRKIHMGYYKP